MKKFIVLLIALAGFLTTDANAQSCCTTKKACKPTVCCPATPNCCETGKNEEGSAQPTEMNGIISQPENSVSFEQPKQPLKKEEKLIAAGGPE